LVEVEAVVVLEAVVVFAVAVEVLVEGAGWDVFRKSVMILIT
jgi:hypothetical protein